MPCKSLPSASVRGIRPLQDMPGSKRHLQRRGAIASLSSSRSPFRHVSSFEGHRCSLARKRSAPSCSSSSSNNSSSSTETVLSPSTSKKQKPTVAALSTSDAGRKPLTLQGAWQWLLGLISRVTEYSMVVAPAQPSLTISYLTELLGVSVDQATAVFNKEVRFKGIYPLILKRNWVALQQHISGRVPVLQQVVLQQPSVLLLSPRQLDDRCTAIARILSLSPSHLASVLLVCPELLLMASSIIRDRARVLKQVMQLSRKQLQGTIRTEPKLLLLEEDGVTLHSSAFARLLGSPVVAASVLRKCPSLLLVNLQRIAKRLQALMEIFGDLQQVVDLVVVWPPVLAVNGQALRGRVRSAEAFLGPGRRGLLLKAPQLLSLRAERLRQNHQGLLALFGTKTAASMVTRAPGVLVLTPQALKSRLDLLAIQLVRPYEDVVSVVGYYPSLLLKGSEAVKEKLYRLVMLFGITYEAAVKMAASCPGLLRRSPEELAAKWYRLHAVVKSSYRWERQLRNMRLSLLARMLMQDALEYDRLQYIQSKKLQASISLHQTLLTPFSSFCSRFPDFPTWRREQQLGKPGQQNAQLVYKASIAMMYIYAIASTPTCSTLTLLPDNCQSILEKRPAGGLDGPLSMDPIDLT